MKHLFSSSELQIRSAPSLIPRCGACGLLKGCLSPKMPVDGEGRKKILVIGEAPGKNEDEKGIPFCGDAGQYLQSKLPVDLRRDCWIMNSLSCRPPKNAIDDVRKIDYCRPIVIKAIEDLQPNVVILLGAMAVKSVIGWLWRSDYGALNRWIGWQIPSQKINAWVCPTWHPSYLVRGGKGKGLLEIEEMLFRNHLQAACSHTKRPWKKVPDYEKRIRVIFNSDEAAEAIEKLTNTDEPIAFDYETDRLKPDRQESRIICCSMSDGLTSIAYPWDGKAIGATRKFLRSRTPKVGSNIKFEERWTRKVFGFGVRNWHWDTMVAAHVMDNRPKITGIEFQAFVHLGFPPWDSEVARHMKAKNANEENTLQSCDLRKLLVYCAYDSLVEWHVAKKQQRHFR